MAFKSKVVFHHEQYWTRPLPDFSESDELSDVTLMVEDKPIHCSRYVLAKASPVFAAMFQGEFKEKTAKEVPLPGKDYDEMLTVIEIIHPPTDFSAINSENAEFILSIADEYQMDHIVKRCQEVMVSNANASNAMEYLWVAQEHGLRTLYKKARSMCIVMDAREFEKSEHFARLYNENKVDLLLMHGKLKDARIDKCVSSVRDRQKRCMYCRGNKPGCDHCPKYDGNNIIDVLGGRKEGL